MQTEMNEKIQELLKNEDYVKHILSLGSAEEMSKELAKEDINLSAEDLRKIYDLAKKKEAGELTDEELQEVAGGLELMTAAILALIVGLGSFGAVIGVGFGCE